jgi:hypothetical protein
MSAVLITTGIVTALQRQEPSWLTSLRGMATSYLIVVAVVYNALVPGTGTAPPWISHVLHIIVPAYAVLDWVLVNDRPALAWRRLWILLPYPSSPSLVFARW